MAMSADYLPIRVDRDVLFEEEGGETRRPSLYLRQSVLETLESHGPELKFADASLITPSLNDPIIVYNGLNRPSICEGYCYVARPSRRMNLGGQYEPVPHDRVFLVFVEKEFGLVVFDWEWRLAADGSGRPIDWDIDFSGGIKWSHT